MKSKTLCLYSTEACHLCELAKAVFTAVAEKQKVVDGIDWQLDIVDIANDEVLFERYGVRIPVVRLLEAESDLGWPFDEAQLDQYLNELA